MVTDGEYFPEGEEKSVNRMENVAIFSYFLHIYLEVERNGRIWLFFKMFKEYTLLHPGIHNHPRKEGRTYKDLITAIVY